MPQTSPTCFLAHLSVSASWWRDHRRGQLAIFCGMHLGNLLSPETREVDRKLQR